MNNKISTPQLQRLPSYLSLLNKLKEEGVVNISTAQIAKFTNLNVEQVKKDIQAISSSPGRPKKGRNIDELISDLNIAMGFDNVSDAIVIGVGSLGNALIKYDGFNKLGMNIVAGFDIDPKIINTSINGKKIYELSRLQSYVLENNIHIAILTVPVNKVDAVLKLIDHSNIRAIWNFVPTVLKVNKDIIVENINLASSLSVLSHQLKTKINKGE